MWRRSMPERLVPAVEHVVLFLDVLFKVACLVTTNTVFPRAIVDTDQLVVDDDRAGFLDASLLRFFD